MFPLYTVATIILYPLCYTAAVTENLADAKEGNHESYRKIFALQSICSTNHAAGPCGHFCMRWGLSGGDRNGIYESNSIMFGVCWHWIIGKNGGTAEKSAEKQEYDPGICHIFDQCASAEFPERSVV